MVKELTRSELDVLANMMALYAADLLFQGQQSHLNLAADVSAVENEARLAKIAELADWQGSADAPVKVGGLVALGGGGGRLEVCCSHIEVR